MKTSGIVKQTLILAVFIVMLFSGNSFSKYYSTPEVVINCRLSSDGTMYVTEKRTYSFSGSFSYAYRNFPNNSKVNFQNFKVSEGSTQYILSDSQKPNTFIIIKRNSGKEVRWFYTARNQTRTFNISYEVKNDIKRYSDAAVLYFQFISDTWDKNTGRVTIVIDPPKPVSSGLVLHWLHGPLHAISEISANGTIVGRCTNLPAYTYLEFRAVYPPDLFKDIPITGRFVKQSIMDEETAWAVMANNQRRLIKIKIQKQAERAKRGLWGAGLISILILGFWYNLFSKYGKRHKISGVPDIASEIPDGITPALASYLLFSRQIYGTAVIATMFDMARKGILKLEEIPDEKQFFKKLAGKNFEWVLDREKFAKLNNELADYEKKLITFLFDNLANGENRLSTKTISKSRSKFMKFFRIWTRLVKKHGKSKNWFDKNSIKAGYKSMIASGILFIITIPAGIYCGVCAVIVGMSAIITFILSLFIMHRTLEGETLAKQLNAVKKYLKKYHFRSDNLYPNIESYVVYGTLFGLTKKHYTELINTVSQDNFVRAVPWYIYSSGSNPSDIAASFSQMITTTTSIMSSASGTGGGGAG